MRVDGFSLPVHDVGQEVVVPQPVVHLDLLVVHGQGAGAYAALVLLGRVGAKLAGENLEDLLADPATLRERGEGEVVRVNLSQTWKVIFCFLSLICWW